LAEEEAKAVEMKSEHHAQLKAEAQEAERKAWVAKIVAEKEEKAAKVVQSAEAARLEEEEEEAAGFVELAEAIAEASPAWQQEPVEEEEEDDYWGSMESKAKSWSSGWDLPAGEPVRKQPATASQGKRIELSVEQEAVTSGVAIKSVHNIMKSDAQHKEEIHDEVVDDDLHKHAAAEQKLASFISRLEADKAKKAEEAAAKAAERKEKATRLRQEKEERAAQLKAQEDAERVAEEARVLAAFKAAKDDEGASVEELANVGSQAFEKTLQAEEEANAAEEANKAEAIRIAEDARQIEAAAKVREQEEAALQVEEAGREAQAAREAKLEAKAKATKQVNVKLKAQAELFEVRLKADTAKAEAETEELRLEAAQEDEEWAAEAVKTKIEAELATIQPPAENEKIERAINNASDAVVEEDVVAAADTPPLSLAKKLVPKLRLEALRLEALRFDALRTPPKENGNDTILIEITPYKPERGESMDSALSSLSPSMSCSQERSPDPLSTQQGGSHPTVTDTQFNSEASEGAIQDQMNKEEVKLVVNQEHEAMESVRASSDPDEKKNETKAQPAEGNHRGMPLSTPIKAAPNAISPVKEATKMEESLRASSPKLERANLAGSNKESEAARAQLAAEAEALRDQASSLRQQAAQERQERDARHKNESNSEKRDAPSAGDEARNRAASRQEGRRQRAEQATEEVHTHQLPKGVSPKCPGEPSSRGVTLLKSSEKSAGALDKPPLGPLNLAVPPSHGGARAVTKKKVRPPITPRGSVVLQNAAKAHESVLEQVEEQRSREKLETGSTLHSLGESPSASLLSKLGSKEAKMSAISAPLSVKPGRWLAGWLNTTDDEQEQAKGLGEDGPTSPPEAPTELLLPPKGSPGKIKRVTALSDPQASMEYHSEAGSPLGKGLGVSLDASEEACKERAERLREAEAGLRKERIARLLTPRDHAASQAAKENLMEQLDQLGRDGTASPLRGEAGSTEDAPCETDDDLKSGLLDVKMQAMEWVRKRQRQREDFYEQNSELNNSSQRMRSELNRSEMKQKLSSIQGEVDYLQTPRDKREAVSMKAKFNSLASSFVDYEALWDQFIASTAHGNTSEIRVSDVPFPSIAKMRASMGLQDNDEAREKTFKKIALRWHPDKFMQRFGSRLHPDDREMIEDKVKDTFQGFQKAKLEMKQDLDAAGTQSGTVG